jgi:hypothetical protein
VTTGVLLNVPTHASGAVRTDTSAEHGLTPAHAPSTRAAGLSINTVSCQGIPIPAPWPAAEPAASFKSRCRKCLGIRIGLRVQPLAPRHFR